MTGWRKRQVIELAREAGAVFPADGSYHQFERHEDLERFAELIRADEAEKYKWDIHSCGPTCTKVGCVAVRKAVEAEREACAKVCDEHAKVYASLDQNPTTKSAWAACIDSRDAIKARGQA